MTFEREMYKGMEPGRKPLSRSELSSPTQPSHHSFGIQYTINTENSDTQLQKEQHLVGTNNRLKSTEFLVYKLGVAYNDVSCVASIILIEVKCMHLLSTKTATQVSELLDIHCDCK